MPMTMANTRTMLVFGRNVLGSGCGLTRGLSTPSSKPGSKLSYTTSTVGSASYASTTGGKQQIPRFARSTLASYNFRPLSSSLRPSPKSDWHSRTYPLSLGLGLGAAMIFSSLVTIHADGQEEPLIICFVGLPGSGKSTQVNRLKKAFGGFEVIDAADAPKKKQWDASQVIIDGYPSTLDQAREFEKRTGTPIFVLVFFDMPQDQWSKRNSSSSSKGVEVYQSSRDSLQPLVNEYRRRGNILEISAEWDDPNEVWEQVEAKVEQVLELRSRGESVAVE